MLNKIANSVDESVGKLLIKLRLNSQAILPDTKFMNLEPITLEKDRQVWQKYLEANPGLFESPRNVFVNRKVAIDLDETLLINSHMCPEIWSIGHGYRDRKIHPAYQYSRMDKTWQGHLKRAWGRTHYDTADRMKYPYLSNPRHIVMFRPGMLSGLEWLGKKGVQLILVTASAKQRIAYLLKRFPLLAKVFGQNIITADDISRYLLAIAKGDRQIKDEASRAVFDKRPYSLALKTPDLIDQILNNGGYDLIVDDSKIMAKIFNQTSLSDRLLWVRPDLPISSYGLQIILAIVNRLNNLVSLNLSLASSVKLLELELDRAFAIQKNNPRLEDPYYWVICHRRDRLLK